MQSLTYAFVAVTNWVSDVNPIPPDQTNVPAGVVHSTTKLVSAAEWVGISLVWAAFSLLLVGAALFRKRRGEFLGAAGFALVAAIALSSPAGQAWIRGIADSIFT
jgi:hypothetical protein